jgi:hypothetical protein
MMIITTSTAEQPPEDLHVRLVCRAATGADVQVGDKCIVLQVLVFTRPCKQRIYRSLVTTHTILLDWRTFIYLSYLGGRDVFSRFAPSLFF